MTRYKAKEFIVEATECTKFEFNERYSPYKHQHAENRFISGYDISWNGHHFFLSKEKFNELYEKLEDDLSCNGGSRTN